MTERWISVWQQSGLELSDSLLAASATSSTIIGFVDQELVLQELEPPDPSMLTSFPSVRAAFGPKHNGDREFELVVRSVIEGVHSRLSSSSETDVVGSSGPERHEIGTRRPRATATRAREKTVPRGQAAGSGRRR
jgi:hypothetical protein